MLETISVTESELVLESTKSCLIAVDDVNVTSSSKCSQDGANGGNAKEQAFQ